MRERIKAARHVDGSVIALLRGQLDALRQLDRQMGSIVTYDEVVTKARQVATLQAHSLTPGVRADLSALLAELHALAGWEALDRNALRLAWDHHEQAKIAAREAESPALLAHALAQQAVVLTDLGDSALAVEQLDQARALARSTPALLRSWLAAAHGEGLAAVGRREDSQRAFDKASALLPSNAVDPELSFLFLDGPHLDRWYGHVLVRLGRPESIPVLIESNRHLDPTFTRAATALKVDLAVAFVGSGDYVQASQQACLALDLATQIGSVRQQQRVTSATAPM